MKRHLHPLLAILALAALCGSGCATVQLDNTERLMAHPDFHRVAAASPLWVGEALKTINRLEAEIERR